MTQGGTGLRAGQPGDAPDPSPNRDELDAGVELKTHKAVYERGRRFVAWQRAVGCRVGAASRSRNDTLHGFSLDHSGLTRVPKWRIFVTCLCASMGYPMTTNRVFRPVAIIAVIVVPLFLVGCATSRDMKLANKGFSHIENGQLVEAEQVLTEAVQANPNNPYALLNLGTVYQRTGRFDEAREMFEKVIAMNPTEKPAKRSKFIEESKNIKEIAEDNLKTLPPKK